jgi:hypothetical protein
MGRKISAGLALAAIVLAGLAWVARVQAQSEAWAAVFAHANRLYEEGGYEEAAAKYEEIVASDLQNGRVYYNLGNAYFKQEKLGLAILNYERAHRLMSRDEDIKANLAYARSQIVDKIETPNPGLLGRWLASLQGLLTVDETTILAWVLYLGMTVLVLLTVFVWRWRRFCLYALGCLSVLLILSLASLGEVLSARARQRGRGDSRAGGRPQRSGGELPVGVHGARGDDADRRREARRLVAGTPVG